MTRLARFAAVSVAALAAPAALAHPGHGTTDPRTLAHYVLEPVHGVFLFAALGMMAFALVLRAREARRSRS